MLEYAPPHVTCADHGVTVADDAVGQTQERVHARFRTADGASERARAQKRGEPADAHGLEERGPGMQTGRRRPASGAGAGPVRRAAFHRRGRDQLQEGPQVHDRGRRPRPGRVIWMHQGHGQKVFDELVELFVYGTYLRLLLFSWVRSWVVVVGCRVHRIGA